MKRQTVCATLRCARPGGCNVPPAAAIRPMLCHSLAAMLSALVAALHPASAAEPVALDQHGHLGQVFSTTGSLRALQVVVPTWGNPSVRVTLTLWDSTARVQRLATRQFTNVADNATVRLPVSPPAPPGVYYWELSDPPSNGRAGVYAIPADPPRPGWAAIFADRVDPSRCLQFTTEESLPAAAWIALLRTATDDHLITEAGRALASDAPPSSLATLAPLLADQRRAHAVRMVFESIPDPEADRLLCAALGSTTGQCRLGIILSLGRRRTPDAVNSLAPLLADADPTIADAAAWALGEIAVPAAGESLLSALTNVEARPGQAQRRAAADAAVVAARRLAPLDPSLARRLLDAVASTPHAAAAAEFALLEQCRLNPAAAPPQLAEWATAEDPRRRHLALWLIQNDLVGSNLTAALIAQTSALPPHVMPGWVAALARRADPAHWNALFSFLQSAAPEIRLAALTAIPDWPPDAEVTSHLLALLDSPDPSTANATATLLRRLPWREVDQAIAARLAPVGAHTNDALLRLAARRATPAALPALLTAARAHPDPDLRAECIRAVGRLATPSVHEALADLAVRAGEDERLLAAIAQAWRDLLGRTPDRDRAIGRLRARWQRLTPAARITTLNIAQTAGGQVALELVIAALDDETPEVRTEAGRRLAEWTSPEAVPALTALARRLPGDDPQRARLLAGALRLCAAASVPPAERAAWLQQLHPLLRTPAERHAWLAAAVLPNPALIALARRWLGEPAVRTETATALLAMCEPLLGTDHAADAIAALREVATATDLPEASNRARDLLRRAGDAVP
ncbi:MAG: HEAT repeat domain-containing protein [Kiritimatiellae bacterium]|nr:HEAT repeat domain-containing protein [Kiritimatiellia bacterium]